MRWWILNNKVLDYNEHYFDVIDTPEKAYFLGLTLADGNVRKYWYGKTGKFMYRFKLALHPIDKEILLKLGKEMKADVKYVSSKTKNVMSLMKHMKYLLRINT